MTELREQLFSTMDSSSMSSIAQDVVSPRVIGAATKMQALIDRIKYKPGFTFTVKTEPFGDHAFLRVETPPVQNTYDRDNPKAVGPLQFIVPIPWFFDDMKLEHQIHWFRTNVIHMMEQHEADEWFLVDDIMCFNPHGERRFPPDA